MARSILDTAPVDPDAMFRQYEAMIHKMARQYHGRSPHLEYDDFVGAGNEAFCHCLTRWDPEIASFSTLLTRALYQAMIRHERKEARHPVGLVEFGEHPGLPCTFPVRCGDGWVEEVRGGLGRDARHVVGLLLEDDLDMRGKRETRFNIRGALHAHLSAPNRCAPKGALKVKWRRHRWDKARREIERAVAAC